MRIPQVLSDRIISIKQLVSLRNPSKIRTDRLVSDVFESSKGLLGIRNVCSGDYGAICDGSKPLRPFFDMFDNFSLRKILKEGFSTNIRGVAPAYLKSKANIPLSTSEVHDCSVAYFYNEANNTHFLFHIPPQMENSSIKRAIELFMPEGFQKAILVPGDNYWTAIHKDTLPRIFETIRLINPETKIDVFHNSSRLPEIVGYNGNVYEIRNTRHILHYSRGQASFKISDVTNKKTLNKINKQNDISELENLRKTFMEAGYDEEILKVLNKYIDKRIAKLSKTS